MKNVLLLIFLFLIHFTLWGQNTNKLYTDTLTEQSLLGPVVDTIPDINIFEDEKPLNITLKYDITSFMKNKNKEEYLGAIFQIHYDKNQEVTKNIRLKARGNFRKGQCIFPPIFLNFKTDPFKNNDLEGIKKVKLVTHCSSAKTNEIYLLKEYLAYKFYNILSDNSFRVRLLNIEYIDTGKKKKNYQRYGFLIEPLDLVAERTNSIEIDPSVIHGENVMEKDADLVALFQYMIGNTDWRFKGGHNMKYIKSLDLVTDKVIPVPYDFDYSGLVNTNYSIPQPWTSIKKVTDREYTGYCRNSDNEYLHNINIFIDRKDEIFETINTFKYLNQKEKNTITNYIQGFYSQLDHPKLFIQTLKYQCRTNNF